MHTILQRQLTRLDNGSSLYVRLLAIVARLNELTVSHGSEVVSGDIERLIKRFPLTKSIESLREIEKYLDEVDKATTNGIKGVLKVDEQGKQKSKKRNGTSFRNKLIDLLPIIIAVILLAVGLSLGLTVFQNSQDALYYTLESIKDIAGSLMAYVCAQQVVNHKKKQKNNMGLIIISSIFGLLALMFSIVLWVATETSLVERFTQWDKLTYFWVGITLLVLAIICAVSIVWYLLTYSPSKKRR